MSGSRHAAPMFVDVDGQARPLVRLRLGERGDEDGKRREAFIQNLVHDHPGLVPMTEIEPAFTPLISVCREMPTSAGYVDNLWVTPWGGIVVGEAKLVRNPQARREVVAQVLDYARALTAWSYDDLQNAARVALKHPTFSLWELVKEASDLDEEQYVDAVERRLRTGRLMLLIIGDGIQEGVEALTAHLQLHAGLHVGLALLDLSLWRDVNGGLIVVPRVPMRTVLIERGIVRIDGGQTKIDAMPSETLRSFAAPPPSAKAITSCEAEFYDHLGAKRPELVVPLKAFFASLAELGITVEFRKSAVLRLQVDPDRIMPLGYFDAGGKVWFDHAASSFAKIGFADAAETYLNELALFVGGAVKRYERSSPQVLGPDGKGVDAAMLLQRGQDWKNAIANLKLTVG